MHVYEQYFIQTKPESKIENNLIFDQNKNKMQHKTINSLFLCKHIHPKKKKYYSKQSAAVYIVVYVNTTTERDCRHEIS